VQVVAVLAHELGHWKLGHTLCLMAGQQAILLAQFVLFAVFRSSDHLLEEFGFVDKKPVIVSLTLFMMVIGPVDKLISWLFNLLSRRCAPPSPCAHTHARVRSAPCCSVQ
jgi:STE24 endopeptidase